MALDSNFASLAEGQIFGPYQEFGMNGKKTIRVSKVLKVKQLADSVRVKHILISYKGAQDVPGSENFTITTEAALFATADSLYKKLEKNPALFDEMVLKNSNDITTKGNGGDIGWVNQTNKYSYMFDSCMLNNGSTLMKIPGRDGIHLVKVIQQGALMKKVNVGTISIELKISEETKLAVRATAMKAADLLKNKKENIDSMATKNGYRILQQAAIGKQDLFVQGLKGAREIVKWAYNASTGDVSDVFDISENFVVVSLQKEYEEGFKSVDDEQVKRELEMKVRNQKKGEILQKKVNDAIAKGAKTIQEIKNSVPELYIEKSNPGPLTGNVIYADEHDMIGMAGALPANTMSKAIVGKRGVYVVFVIRKSGLQPITDFTQEANEINRNNKNFVEQFVGDALKTNADIEDYRFEKLD
jgi:peptidylprolyl isomerase/peptidyl-prolyl cis-trans isomerase D